MSDKLTSLGAEMVAGLDRFRDFPVSIYPKDAPPPRPLARDTLRMFGYTVRVADGEIVARPDGSWLGYHDQPRNAD